MASSLPASGTAPPRRHYAMDLNVLQIEPPPPAPPIAFPSRSPPCPRPPPCRPAPAAFAAAPPPAPPCAEPLAAGLAAAATRVDARAAHAMHADLAAQTYYVTGAGLRIGILSDSFHRLGGAAADTARGGLPAQLTILKEGTRGNDEGRAMGAAHPQHRSRRRDLLL